MKKPPSKTIYSPHDHLFKSAMADRRVAQDFLQTHLPEIVREALDLETLILQPTSYVDQSLKTVSADVLYQTRLKTSTGEGETAFVYLLCEHQSTVDSLMPLRIWQYVIRIWADYIKQCESTPKQLPLIVPLVFYTGEAAYTGSIDLRELIQAPRELIDQALFRQTFHLVENSQAQEDGLSQRPWAGMMALMMKHGRDRDIVLFLKQTLGALRRLEQAGGTDFVVLLLNYCLTTGETLNVQEFVATVQQGLSPLVGEKIMTIAQQFEARGEARGKMEGKVEAMKEYALNALNENLPLATIQKLTGLSAEELKLLQERNKH